MASYCGKDCETCTEREKMGCGGCGAWMEAKTWPGACGIAQCCRSKGHNSCETCTTASYCAKLKGRGQEPWYSLRRLESDANARRQLQERGRFFGKWMMLLFWLFVPGIVAGVMTSEKPRAVKTARRLSSTRWRARQSSNKRSRVPSGVCTV